MSGFNDVTEGDFDRLFIKEYELLDQFVQSKLWTCGYNKFGNLGDNSTTSKSSPVTTSGGGSIWKQVDGNSSSVIGVKTDGTMWAWGYNTSGTLGDGATTSKSSPVQISGSTTSWKQCSVGSAIKTDGTLWVWGPGPLGDGTTTSKSSPVTTSGGGTNWRQVSGRSAVKTDGTLWTWGANTNGILGDASTVTSRTSPVTTAGGGTNWKTIAQQSSFYHTAAIKTDGTLWTWGLNTSGELGDSSAVASRTSPVTTAGGGSNWRQVAVGYAHTAAVKTDGTLWTWGYNGFGQLGNGDSNLVAQSSPVSTAGGGTTWKQVAVGFYHTVAIKSDGTMWSFGQNDYGQLGLNSTTSKSSPTQVTIVPSNVTWKQVSCGSYFFAAVTE